MRRAAEPGIPPLWRASSIAFPEPLKRLPASVVSSSTLVAAKYQSGNRADSRGRGIIAGLAGYTPCRLRSGDWHGPPIIC
jgi:hypothetical protein